MYEKINHSMHALQALITVAPIIEMLWLLYVKLKCSQLLEKLIQINRSSSNPQHPLCSLTLVSVCLGVSSIWELGWAWASAGWQQASQLASWAMRAWGAQLSSRGFLWAWSSFWFSQRSWVSTGSLLPSFSPRNKHPNISTTRSVLYVAAGEKV